jgi:hypothetical protein
MGEIGLEGRGVALLHQSTKSVNDLDRIGHNVPPLGSPGVQGECISPTDSMGIY